MGLCLYARKKNSASTAAPQPAEESCVADGKTTHEDFGLLVEETCDMFESVNARKNKSDVQAVSLVTAAIRPTRHQV